MRGRLVPRFKTLKWVSWFLRNGIRAASSGDNESLANCTKWTEMVGEMVMLSVGPGDQVG